jgi:hypothetical protein
MQHPLPELEVNENDKLWLQHHFNRPITWPRATLGRTASKIPIVVRMSCFGNSGPCPTLYWLVEPNLIKATSRLEAIGTIKRFEERLEEDPHAMQLLCEQHERYKSLRSNFCTIEELSALNGMGIEHPDHLGGIAGIKRPNFIKCLHTHLAHYLATGDNIVGSWTAPLLESNLGTLGLSKSL